MIVRTYKYRARAPLGVDVGQAIDDLMWRVYQYQNEVVRVRGDADRARLAVLSSRVVNVDRRVKGRKSEWLITYEDGSVESCPKEPKIRDADVHHSLRPLRIGDMRVNRQRAVSPECAAKLEKIKPKLGGKDGCRKRSKLYWGTYQKAEEAKGPQSKHFKRWDDCSTKLAVHFQTTPTKVAAVFSMENTLLRIERKPDEGGVVSGSRRSGRNVLVHMRINDTTADAVPKWATWPVILHRDLPRDALITWAWIQRRKMGTDWRWEFVVVLKLEGPKPDTHVDPSRQGRVAIDLNYRSQPDGIRIAYWQDESGRAGSVDMPRSIQQGMKDVEQLVADRETKFNALKPVVMEWIKQQSPAVLPDWFLEKSKTIRMWKSPNRMSRLVWWWYKRRFPADAEFYPQIDEWRRWDRRIHNEIANKREHLIESRNAIYRDEALRIARTYRVVVIEKLSAEQLIERDLRNKNGASADETKRLDLASKNRQKSAPWTFRSILKSMCTDRGTSVLEVDAAYSSMDCSGCGARGLKDPGLIHRCPSCGKEVDRDVNACLNLLKRSSGVVSPERSEVQPPGKSARSVRMLAGRRKRVTG